MGTVDQVAGGQAATDRQIKSEFTAREPLRSHKSHEMTHKSEIKWLQLGWCGWSGLGARSHGGKCCSGEMNAG